MRIEKERKELESKIPYWYEEWFVDNSYYH
jgi:hypothetical protein